VHRNDELPAGYRTVIAPPPVAEYLELRTRSGLSSRRKDQAEAALTGSWFAVSVVFEATGETVGMGRVIGDGGWCFHILDMAVLPEHQRRGLGDVILTMLLDRIRSEAPAGAFVNLLADPPGRALYKRHGFVETAPHSVGMALITDSLLTERAH
jgi:GNAT superfamily N-acetyltransferase